MRYSVVFLHVSPIDGIVVAKTTVRSVQEQLCYQIINLHGYRYDIFAFHLRPPAGAARSLRRPVVCAMVADRRRASA